MTDYTAEDAKRDIAKTKEHMEILNNEYCYVERLIVWLAERKLEREEKKPDYSTMACKFCMRPLHPFTGFCPVHAERGR